MPVAIGAYIAVELEKEGCTVEMRNICGIIATIIYLSVYNDQISFHTYILRNVFICRLKIIQQPCVVFSSSLYVQLKNNKKKITRPAGVYNIYNILTIKI